VTWPHRTGHQAQCCAAKSAGRLRVRHDVTGQTEPDALTVDLSARPHAFHDFLAGVAAFGVADVAVLQSCLVRDLFLAEVVAEPRRALCQSQPTERGVACWPAAVPASSIQKNLPKLGQLFDR